MNNFDSIPDELKLLKQWCLWRYEDVGSVKPTKIPYTKDHRKLSVTNPSDWLSFGDAVAIHNFGGYDGIGFVFSKSDPYAFIDLDATQDKDSIDRQLKVFKDFDSYSEKSPSGKGLHIIVKGSIPQGRKRADIEIYSSERYATMTGDVFLNNPIKDKHDLLNMLFDGMGKPPQTINSGNLNEPQTQSDEEIYKAASEASNGQKFIDLYNGEWKEYFPIQAANGQGSSEGCYALVDIIAFYTQNRVQIKRMFLHSKLGNVKKYLDRQDLIDVLIEKSFDRLPPKMDFDGFRIQLESQLQLPLEKQSVPNISDNRSSNDSDSANINAVVRVDNPLITPPPGLVGDIARFIYEAAPRPVPEIALAGAMGLMAGICGRAYNISGTGLNQYILCLAMTGAGKEAMASGIDKIINEVQKSVPVAFEFIGPAEIASGQALVKYLANKSQSFVSILGEFGLRLRSMSSERANSAEVTLRRMLLDLYNKSGHGQMARPSIYADSEKNTNIISSPAFSILGESTPERFYEVLNEEMISEGLLPRFMIIEYHGKRPPLNEAAIGAQPSAHLVDRIANLMAFAKTTMANKKVIDIVSTNDADKMLRSFDKLADKQINSTDKEIIKQLWNRAHIKVMKIAATLAVGVNIVNPIMEIEHVEWAIKIVENDIRTLSEKFISGIIGKSSDELKQMMEIKRMIKVFVTTPWEKASLYSDNQQMHAAKIIPYSYLNKRLVGLSAFRHDKMGATKALRRSIDILIDSDYMRKVSKKDMIEKFSTTQEGYVISNMSMLE